MKTTKHLYYTIITLYLIIGVKAQKQQSNIGDWTELESQNYEQYTANLKGAQCPPYIIKAILSADIRKTLANGDIKNQEQKLQILYTESQIISNLTGQTIYPFSDNILSQSQETQILLNHLTNEKRTQVAEKLGILESEIAKDQETIGTNKNQIIFYTASQDYKFQATLEDINTILNPNEFRETKIRIIALNLAKKQIPQSLTAPNVIKAIATCEADQTPELLPNIIGNKLSNIFIKWKNQPTISN